MPCFFSKRKTLKAPPSRKLPHLFQLQLFCIFTSRWQRAGTWIFIREEAASHKKNAKKENKPWWHLSTGLRVFLFGLFGNAHYLLQGPCFCFYLGRGAIIRHDERGCRRKYLRCGAATSRVPQPGGKKRSCDCNTLCH